MTEIDPPQAYERNPDPTALTGNPNTSDVDYAPDPSKSLGIPIERQKIIDSITALYSGKGDTEAHMHVYAEKAIYDDPFSYCNTRYKVAGQWYGIPMCFSKSETLATQIVQNDKGLLVFKMRQRWVPKGLGWVGSDGAGKQVDCLVSLSLDGEGKVKYHKDMWNEKDYSHEGLGKIFKTLQGDQTVHLTRPPKTL